MVELCNIGHFNPVHPAVFSSYSSWLHFISSNYSFITSRLRFRGGCLSLEQLYAKLSNSFLEVCIFYD